MDSSKSLVLLSQKTFVFNEDGRFLTLFRTETAPTRPLTWDLPGGDFEMGETLKEGAEREIREESGIEVNGMVPLTVEGFTNEKGEFWVTVVYKARAISTDVTLSFEHNDYKWVTPAEFMELKSSEKWRRIVRENLL